MTAREERIARTLVELADTLVDRFDMVDVFALVIDRCVDVLEVEAASLCLASPDGRLQVMASSSELVAQLDASTSVADASPQRLCFESGQAVVVCDLEAARDTWPAFTAAAEDLGFKYSAALPLRSHGTVLGTLTLFGADDLSEDQRALAQAFADVASISLLHDRVVNQQHVVNEQLQKALDSRVAVEQAKGVISERHRVDMDEAFAMLRRHARSHNIRLGDVVRGVLDGSVRLSP